jgi:hypothetical protein
MARPRRRVLLMVAEYGQDQRREARQRDDDGQQHAWPGRGSADSVSVQHGNSTDDSAGVGVEACTHQYRKITTPP